MVAAVADTTAQEGEEIMMVQEAVAGEGITTAPEDEAGEETTTVQEDEVDIMKVRCPALCLKRSIIL